MDLFTLSAKLTMDTADFDKKASNAANQGQNIASKLTSAASKVTVFASKVVKSAVPALTNLAKKAAAAGDKIDKQAQKVGISRKAYQEWDYILSQNGSSIDKLSTFMKKMNSAIDNGKDAVTKLGLSFDDLNTMSTEEKFEAIVKAFQEMPDGAEKSALALEIFGKSGDELNALLNSSADSVDELKKKFEELGIAMSDEQIEASVKFNDSMDTLNRTFEAIKIAIGAELLPVMTEWADKAAAYAGKLLKAYKTDGLEGVFNTLTTDLKTFTDSLRESGNPLLQSFADIIDGISATVKTVVGLFTDWDKTIEGMKLSDDLAIVVLGYALDFIKQALTWIKANWKLVETGLIAIGTALAAWKIAELVSNLNPLTIILAAIAALATVIITNWEPISEFFVKLWGDIKTAVDKAWTSVKNWWNHDIAEPLERAWNGVTKFFSDLWEAISTAASDAWTSVKTWWTENISQPVSEAWNAVQEAAELVWEATKTAASTAWNAIKDAVTGAITSAKATLARLWSGIKLIASTVWETIKSTAKSVWDSIKKFITDPVETAKKTLADIWSAIKKTATDTWNAIKEALEPVISAITGFIDGIVNAVKDAIEWIEKLLGFNGKSVSMSYTVTRNEVVNKKTQLDQTTPGTAEWEDAIRDYLNLPASHAKGDWNVPYDNYSAMLHRGEMVLTASQARRYRDGETGSGINAAALENAIIAAIQKGMANATVNSYLDGRKVTDEINKYQGADMAARRFA